jgi:hypothetical protein
LSNDERNKSVEIQLTEDAVEKEIGAAFSPLKCEVKWVDYGDRLRWEVFGTNGRPLQPMELTKNEACSPSQLHAHLSSYRKGLERNGYKLDPWPKIESQS